MQFSSFRWLISCNGAAAEQKFAWFRNELLRDFLYDGKCEMRAMIIMMTTLGFYAICTIMRYISRRSSFPSQPAVTLDRDQCRNVRAKLWKKSPSSGSLKATFIISDPGTAADQKPKVWKCQYLTIQSMNPFKMDKKFEYGHSVNLWPTTSFFTHLEIFLE